MSHDTYVKIPKGTPYYLVEVVRNYTAKGNGYINSTFNITPTGKVAVKDRYIPLKFSSDRHPDYCTIDYNERYDYISVKRSDVELTEEPPPESTKVKALSIRDRMVPKSEWRVKNAFSFHGEFWAQGYSRISKTLPFNVGDTIVITDKFRKIFGVEGLSVKIKHNGVESILQFSAAKDNIEEVSVPVTPVWLLRDKTTGKFYKGPDYQRRGVPQMSDKITGGKKYTDLGKVKSSILIFSGYYDGLPTDEVDSAYDALGGYKLFDLPSSWEAVKFNKVTRDELETVDIQSWYVRTWSFRALTIKYGSSVRKVFSQLEKNGKVDEFKGLLVFQVPPTIHTYTGVNKQQYSYEKQDEISNERLQDIRTAIDQASVTKKDLVRAQDFKSVSVAFRTSAIATMVRLSYSGDLKPYVINLEDMKEVVG